KHEHVLLTLDNGKEIRFEDARRFGMISVSDIDQWQAQAEAMQLGVEPLSDAFTPEYLLQRASHSAKPIKHLIMDQVQVVGVGNIYASEALFQAKIHPLLPAKRLKLAGAKRLVQAIKHVLERAIDAGGTTLQDFVNSNGEAGTFQVRLHVYDRGG